MGVPIADASRRPPRADGPRRAAQDIPPGRYGLVVVSGLNVSGTVRVALGRPDQTLTSCALVDQAPGTTSCVIALPAGASAVWMESDAAMARTAQQLALALIEPGAPDACGLRAERAIVAPAGTVFVVSGRAWAERAGLWTA